MWQECGFCSLDNSADLVRHVYFHCYHTKLKQWGLQALRSQADLGPCILDFHSRNIIPDIPDHFLCLWEHCEVSGRRWDGRKGVRVPVIHALCSRGPARAPRPFWVAPLVRRFCPHQVNWAESQEAPFGHGGGGKSPSPALLPAQSTFDNPEWFYRHVEAHSLCCEYTAVGKDSPMVLCGWKGRPPQLLGVVGSRGGPLQGGSAAVWRDWGASAASAGCGWSLTPGPPQAAPAPLRTTASFGSTCAATPRRRWWPAPPVGACSPTTPSSWTTSAARPHWTVSRQGGRAGAEAVLLVGAQGPGPRHGPCWPDSADVWPVVTAESSQPPEDTEAQRGSSPPCGHTGSGQAGL